MNQRVEKLEQKVSSLISVQNRCRQVMERFIELFNKLNMSITQRRRELGSSASSAHERHSGNGGQKILVKKEENYSHNENNTIN